MPWRVGPAERVAGVWPDPYRVWLSEVMLQQTTVVTVRDYFQRFTTRWPTVEALAAADDGDVMGEWAGLGYYARARNLLKCARVVAGELGGRFPDTVEGLVKLPGIGPYTAAAVASIAFDRAATVVDGNVERVMARYYRVMTPLPLAKAELTALAEGLTPVSRAGDYAQAVMDLGATVCTPKSPACGICPCCEGCVARLEGLQAELPRKLIKPVKPTRYGIVYLAQRADGAWLLERRENKGLLGGMLGWPGAVWGAEALEDAPMEAGWIDPEAEVRHTFTHFHLRLGLRVARVGDTAVVQVGSFVEPDDFRPSDLPTVMRKAYDLASTYLSES
ncbi:MAG: A/G-specific adenine glycosylase [Paracoccaceae bacterium]